MSLHGCMANEASERCAEYFESNIMETSELRIKACQWWIHDFSDRAQNPMKPMFDLVNQSHGSATVCTVGFLI